jgi:predicted nucleic acid-binding Zn finger protein
MSDLNNTTDPRQARGKLIAETAKITRAPKGRWLVPSQSGVSRRYTVSLQFEFCTCPDFEERQLKCKHMWAVEYAEERITSNDDETVTESVKVTYSQSWSVYNQAQTHEHERFLPLLRELCDGIEQPVQAFGRPRLPLSDVVFALGVKTYSTLSGRRADSFVREAAADGLMDSAPSYNTAFRYHHRDAP